MEQLTGDQVIELARALKGTSANVYHQAKAMFGVDAEEEIFGALLTCDAEPIFKCIECGIWESIDSMSDENDDMCEGCLLELNGAEDE